MRFWDKPVSDHCIVSQEQTDQLKMRTGYNKSVPLALDGKNESACGDASADCDWLVHQDRTVSDGSAGVTEHSSNSHLSEKIEVVQQVMTVLETTISSATSAYESVSYM